MAFQAPRIIGGGQIIRPQAQSNPFEGIYEAMQKNRDRKQAAKQFNLDAINDYMDKHGKLEIDDVDADGNPIKRIATPEEFMQQIGDVSGSTAAGTSKLGGFLDKIGYGQGQWAPGKFAGMGLLGAAGLGLKGLGAAGRGISNAFQQDIDSSTGVPQPNPNQGISPSTGADEPPIDKFDRLAQEYKNQQFNQPTNQITGVDHGGYGDTGTYNPQDPTIIQSPERPNVPVAEENDYLTQDITVDQDPQYKIPGLMGFLQRAIPGGKSGMSPFDPNEFGDWESPAPRPEYQVQREPSEYDFSEPSQPPIDYSGQTDALPPTDYSGETDAQIDPRDMPGFLERDLAAELSQGKITEAEYKELRSDQVDLPYEGEDIDYSTGPYEDSAPAIKRHIPTFGHKEVAKETDLGKPDIPSTSGTGDPNNLPFIKEQDEFDYTPSFKPVVDQDTLNAILKTESGGATPDSLARAEAREGAQGPYQHTKIFRDDIARIFPEHADYDPYNKDEARMVTEKFLNYLMEDKGMSKEQAIKSYNAGATGARKGLGDDYYKKVQKNMARGGYMGIGNNPGGYSLVGGGNVPGRSTGDTNPAMLEDGEYVLNRNAVKALGKGYLDYINDQRFPRFQSGGQYDEGFEGQGMAGGRAKVVVPQAMDNSGLFGGGGGGGNGEGDDDKMAMAMKFAPMLFGAPPMQYGGYVPGYQFGGGFQAPAYSGQKAQVVRPESIGKTNADFISSLSNPEVPEPIGTNDNGWSQDQHVEDTIALNQTPERQEMIEGIRDKYATDPNTGMTNIGQDKQTENDFFQRGGYIPGYQQGGAMRRPTGYLWGGFTGSGTAADKESDARLEDRAQRNRNTAYESKLLKAREAHDTAYDADRKVWEESVGRAESGMSGFGGNFLDFITPGFLEGPLASWATGVPDAQNWSNVPRQRMENYFSQISPHRTQVPENVLMNPELSNLKRYLEEIPGAPPYKGMSNEALKKLYNR